MPRAPAPPLPPAPAHVAASPMPPAVAQPHAPPAPLRPAAPDFKFAPRSAASATIPDALRCPQCGAQNQRGLRFCVSCGCGLEGTAPPAPVPAPARPPTAPMPMQPSPPSASPAIAPARVVDLGGPPAPKVTMRVCARCRGTCDGAAQFCKFCGAPLAEGAPAPSVAAPPTAPTAPIARDAIPASAAPDTPAIDAHAYRPFQAMSAQSSAQGAHPSARAAQPSQASQPTQRPPAPDPRAATGLMSAVEVPAPLASAPARAEPRGRIVIIARDGGEGPAFPLGEGDGRTTDIGRTEGDVLLTEDRYVSPRHARLQRRGDGIYLRDLGSVNGIYLRIPVGSGSGGDASQHGLASQGLGPGPQTTNLGAATDLVDQDLFLVGQQVLRFEVVNDAEEGYGTASQHGTLLFGTPAAPRYARLSQRTVEGVTRDVFYIRKVETVLGRESGDIVFTEDPFLSRRHATIRYDRDKKKFSLADLGSSNGTFLQIREEVRLKDGDHFRIGQQLFRVDIEVPPTGGPRG